MTTTQSTQQTAIDAGNLAPSPVVTAPPASAQPAPAAQPDPAPAPSTVAPGEDPEWLKQRLERATKKAERELAAKLGFKDPDEARQRLARATELEAQDERRRQEALSETERERDRATKAEQRAQKAEAEKAELEEQIALRDACIKHGIQNATYARFLLDDARKRDPGIEIGAVIAEALGTDAHKIALGVQAPDPRAVPVAPTVPGAAPPAPPVPGLNLNATADASAMPDADWKAYKRSIGLHG